MGFSLQGFYDFITGNKIKIKPFKSNGRLTEFNNGTDSIENPKQVALRYLEGLDLMLFNVKKDKRDILNDLYFNGEITYKEIETALEKAVLNVARRYYNLSTRKKNPCDPSSLSDDGCFIYGLTKEGFFSEKEITAIYFDHGYTVENYVKTYGRKDLLSNLRKKVLSPKQYPKFSSFFDEHPACC